MSYRSMFQDVRDAVDWVHYKVLQAASLPVFSLAHMYGLILTLQVEIEQNVPPF